MEWVGAMIQEDAQRVLALDTQIAALEATMHQVAYSDPSRPLIPTQVGHPFRRNAATDSDRKPATFSSLLGIGGRHPSD